MAAILFQPHCANNMVVDALFLYLQGGVGATGTVQ